MRVNILIFWINKNLSSVLYSFIVYNSLAYCYFHFFNMSETARRIRILTEIKKKSSVASNELTNFYKSDFMIKTRLERLINLGQVRLIGNKYVLSAKILYLASIIVYNWRKILGFVFEI